VFVCVSTHACYDVGGRVVTPSQPSNRRFMGNAIFSNLCLLLCVYEGLLHHAHLQLAKQQA
jgi:hypothetical protein